MPSSSNSNTLGRHTSTHLRFAMSVVGVLVVLVGLADLSSRAANKLFGSTAHTTIFGPVGTLLQDQPVVSADFATTTPITPIQIDIPSIGVHAHVQEVGKKTDGSMATPTNFADVGWYALGSKPGEAGNAVIAGHVNNARTTSGVFEHLSDVVVGDYITVSDKDGKTLLYRVREVAQYTTHEAPSEQIFTATGPTQIVLVTCGGDWDTAAHTFDKRFVVYAQLATK